jgi:hypothetical protein
MTRRPMYRGPGPGTGLAEAETTPDPSAIRDMAAYALSDPALLGFAGILLASRPCSAKCLAGRRPDFG